MQVQIPVAVSRATGQIGVMSAWAGKPVSSPRVRGTGRSRVSARDASRVIPACAGNRGLRGGRSRRGSCHPRVCGEQSWKPFGLSRSTRVIPACAGNRESRILIRPSRWCHPSVCGEQSSTTSPGLVNAGSSLRVRGTGDLEERGEGVGRVIPACAGNSGIGRRSARTLAGHPCVCGERGKELTERAIEFGSSLRVRGTVRHSAHVASLFRVTPACAGNRRWSPTR